MRLKSDPKVLQIRIFEEIMAKPPSDGSESLQVALSACKLIDLLLVLQTEEFQMFVPCVF